MEFYTDKEIIKHLRQVQGGMTQRDFAARLGVSLGYLCDVLNGKSNPGRKIENALRALAQPKSKKGGK